MINRRRGQMRKPEPTRARPAQIKKIWLEAKWNIDLEIRKASEPREAVTKERALAVPRKRPLSSGGERC